MRRLAAAGMELKPFSRETLEASYKASQEFYAELSAKSIAREASAEALIPRALVRISFQTFDLRLWQELTVDGFWLGWAWRWDGFQLNVR